LSAAVAPMPETGGPTNSSELPVALLTPTGRDSSVAERVLNSAGIPARTCSSMEDVCRLISHDEIAVLVIAEEALDHAARMKLFEALNKQPSWSDVPIVLLTGEGELSDALPRALSGVAVKGNVTLLERPVRVATLTTVIRSAQRARQRQLDVRDLVESERAARRQVEEANSAKSQFLATMSHELRTPLNAIAGYTQLLALGVRGEVSDDQKADLERIDRSQRHLLSLINDILNFAKVEAGHVAVETVPVDICHLVDNLEGLVEPQLREKNLKYTIRHEVGDAVAIGDADKVRQILLNLLSNAIKFTDDGGAIDVVCRAEDDTIAISVRDDGSGIPADKMQAIFEPFVQVGRDFTTPHGGTGLGLSISRDLARRMGGDLTAESDLGQGSEFTLTLRRAKL
jgi:signal transduction histidine kinase